MDLTNFLSMELSNAPTETDFELGLRTSLGVGKGDYTRLHSYRNVLSYSMSELLHACPRKFQIAKLSAASGQRNYSSSTTFAFGHSVGAGVAVYDKTQNLEAAIFAAFLSWNVALDAAGKPSAYGTDPKESFAWAVNAIRNYASFYHNETDLADWEVIEIEAAMLVDLETEPHLGYTFFDTGHADVVLRHRETGVLRIKENKTSGRNIIHPAMYSNSAQALGYSVIASVMGETDYEVLYTIYSKKEERWVQFDFPKSVLMRAEWAKSRLMLAEEIDSMAQGNFFPMRGSNCFAYNSECHEFQMCQMNLERRFGMRFGDLQIATKEDLLDIEEFTHVVTLSEIKQSLRETVGQFSEMRNV